MTKPRRESSYESAIFATTTDRRKQVESWVGDTFSKARKGAFLIVVGQGQTAGDFMQLPNKVARALLVFEHSPVEMDKVDSWRIWAMERGAWEVHVAFLPFYEGADEARYKEIVRQCKGWNAPPAMLETVKIKKGDYVQMSPDSSDRNLATLLTMTLGTAMGELLTRVETLARRFKEKGVKPASKAAADYLKEIAKLLENKETTESPPELKDVKPSPDRIPKLLLRGDSGVGKSLIAGYLHSRSGGEGRHLRISIPEYLEKEDMFEYDFFGYAKGAYTGGKEEGSAGLLLSHVGQVVFLDEIGEANEYLQAKLLAFLDDYRVRPRGWEGKPFYCPVAIVAATNKNLTKMAEEGTFRGDLLARFTDRHVIPGLNDRIGDLPFILDCLLQREAMNPNLEIERVGEGAYDALKNRDYTTGNFRQLENLFRSACELALRDDRKDLVRADVEQAATADQNF